MSVVIFKIVGVAVLILIGAALLHRWMIRRGSLRHCPLCRTVIDGAATVCPACQRDL